MISRTFSLLYGLVAYLAFFATILYAIGFVGNMVVPKTVDVGNDYPLMQALWVNLALMVLWTVQHSVMARQWFKAWWTKIIPAHLERSTYVLVSSLLLAFIFWQWRSTPQIVWQIENPIAQYVLWGMFFLGWGMVFFSSFIIDHFDLFGLRQVYINWKGEKYSHLDFKTVSLYKCCRHPLMLGFLLAIWSAPTMTVGHLVFSIGLTGYIFLGTKLEERDLCTFFGDEYRQYQKSTPMIVPCPFRRKSKAPTS